MKAYDLHVHSIFSEGLDSLEELARQAELLGFEGICYVTYFDEEKIEQARKEIEKFKGRLKIFLGVEARSMEELKQILRQRRLIDLVLVRGGDLRLNRYACLSKGVDLLTHPSLGRKDCGLDAVSAREASRNQVAIEINLREILFSEGRQRARVLKNLKELVKLGLKYGFPLVACSGATNRWELLDPLVLSSFLCCLGIEPKLAKLCVQKQAEEVVKKALEKKKSLLPGVKVL